MRTIITSVLVLFLYTIPGYSISVPVKYGKLSEEEINLKSYESADAVILHDFGQMYFDGRLGSLYLYRSRHVRIKILTEAGLKYAQQSISFYDLEEATFYQSNKAFELKAQTLNIGENGKIKKTRVKPRYWSQKGADDSYMNELSFTFQNVKVGSILEYKINIPTIEVVNPEPWYLQYEIPVLHSELWITSPENIAYALKSYNTSQIDFFETTYPISSISYPRGHLSVQSYRIQIAENYIPALPKDAGNNQRMYLKLILDEASQSHRIPGISYLFRATDPAFKLKDKSEKQSTLTNNSYILYRKPNLETLPEKMRKDTQFGMPLTIPLHLSDSVQLRKMKPDEAIDYAYTVASKGMNWNGEKVIFVDPVWPKMVVNLMSRLNISNLNKSLSKPLNKQSGSNAEINFIFINLLRKAGLKADPVLTATTDRELPDPEFFNLHMFNHVIVRVETAGKIQYLDATLNNEGKSLLESGAIYPQGLVITNTEAFWVNIE